jgi:hypothetical protein
MAYQTALTTTETREQICTIASNRTLTKQQRNEKIANLIIAFLMSAGHFEMYAGEIMYWGNDGDVGWPLSTFLNERKHGDLLHQLGVSAYGTYDAYMGAVVGKLALEMIAAIEDPEMEKYFS